jgi:hypothetical protein
MRRHGDLARVKQWFDSAGVVRNLDDQYPYNDPERASHLQWDTPTAQQVLDVALAFAVINRHFDVADVLLEHGADINTNWNSHEPASILHHLVFLPNPYESMRFLIDRGIDMTIKDYRWDSNAVGWARYGYNDEKMAHVAGGRGTPAETVITNEDERAPESRLSRATIRSEARTTGSHSRGLPCRRAAWRGFAATEHEAQRSPQTFTASNGRDTRTTGLRSNRAGCEGAETGPNRIPAAAVRAKRRQAHNHPAIRGSRSTRSKGHAEFQISWVR